MNTPDPPTLDLPPPDVVASQIVALQEELKALRRLWKASKAAALAADKAAEVRAGRQALAAGPGPGGPPHAA
jgi:hypothetical protein